MPPDMELSMRHTKLKAEEAALLAGEITKPTWESRNEGIHERVSFEDCIWGFDLAGGIYYKTPLRVTAVKPDSRAEKAGIRPGDRLLKINDIDTSTLTIQEAHDMILSSGIHLKISVTSPDDDEDAYYCYEDPIVDDGYDSEEERRLEEEKARKRQVHARVSSYWSLQWPWVSKRRLIYRESNCFMVNSKYEETRRDKYPPLPTLRYTDDILLYQRDGDKLKNNNNIAPSIAELKKKSRQNRQQKLTNGDTDSHVSSIDNDELSQISEELVNNDSRIPTVTEDNEQEDSNTEAPIIEEPLENGDKVDMVNGQDSDEHNDILSPIPEVIEETPQFETIENSDNIIEQSVNDDDVINEVLAKNDSVPRSDDDNILDSILSDDGQNLENSEANNER